MAELTACRCPIVELLSTCIHLDYTYMLARALSVGVTVRIHNVLRNQFCNAVDSRQGLVDTIAIKLDKHQA